MAEFPLVNGTMHDFTSIEFTMNGTVRPKVKEISYTLELAPTDVYGTPAQKVGRTRGQLKPEASVTMYKAEFDDLVFTLGLGYMESVFNIVVNYSDPGTDIHTDELKGCRIMKWEVSASSGADPVEVAIDLNVMDILYGQVAAVINTLAT